MTLRYQPLQFLDVYHHFLAWVSHLLYQFSLQVSGCFTRPDEQGSGAQKGAFSENNGFFIGEFKGGMHKPCNFISDTACSEYDPYITFPQGYELFFEI